MNEILNMIFVLVAGLVLGLFFFGGLWLTVKIAFTSKLPALWFFTSLFLRISVAFISFYYLSTGGWPNLILCLIGLIIARFIVAFLTKPTRNARTKVEICHET